MLEDQCGGHGVGVDHPGEAHPAVGQLLDDADVGQEVEAVSPIGLGDGDAEEAEGAHLLDDLGGVAVLPLQLRSDRNDLTGDEPSDGLDDLPAYLVLLFNGHRRAFPIASEKCTSALC